MVSDATVHDLLLKGIYTPVQAARYARLRTSVLKRWLYGSAAGESALRPELGTDEKQFVTFTDLVQAMAVRSIRNEPTKPKVPLQRIRRVVDIAASEYGVTYPFARRHTTYLFDDDIVIRLSDDTLIQITGKYKKQHCIQHVIELYGEDLHYDESGRAEIYEPMKLGRHTVRFNPSVRFGEPIIYPTRYSVDTLVTAVRTEGSFKAAATAYEVKDTAVKLAVRYDDWLQGTGS